MFRKTILLSAVCASSVGLSGCSSLWTMASEFSADMAEVTSFSFLRGSSDKSDVSLAENNIDSVTGIYKTEVGEYVPAEAFTAVQADTSAFGETGTYSEAGLVDTSPHPCPDGTYLTEDETCMSLEVDTYDFGDMDVAMTEQFVDTSQHECPEDTYLNEENACMYFETETFDFEDDVNFVEQIVDTSPHPCPEDTYLTADGSCQILDNETVDLALNINEVTTSASVMPSSAVMSSVPAAPSNAFAANLSVQCPEGFKPNADNSCMYLGVDHQD